MTLKKRNVTSTTLSYQYVHFPINNVVGLFMRCVPVKGLGTETFYIYFLNRGNLSSI